MSNVGPELLAACCGPTTTIQGIYISMDSKFYILVSSSKKKGKGE